MTDKRAAKKRAIVRRNLFYTTCILVIAAVISVVAYLVVLVGNSFGTVKKEESKKPSVSQSAADKKPAKPKRERFVKRGEFTLDAEYTDLLLVNKWNPLPENHEGPLTTIEEKYREPGYNLNQFNEQAYPYLKAMCEAAFADDIPLKVCSPYRAYNIQQILFNRQKDKWKKNGMSDEQADLKAATIVARPGTSEHQTGLAVDFIQSDPVFEKHPAFAWLQENAADYGFILRFPKEDEEKTGVIYEAWHYRFVGIYKAQEIKKSGLCLEEYLEKYGKKDK